MITCKVIDALVGVFELIVKSWNFLELLLLDKIATVINQLMHWIINASSWTLCIIIIIVVIVKLQAKNKLSRIID